MTSPRSVFTDAELTFLEASDIGRLATMGSAGLPHVVPAPYIRNPELDTIDVVGPDLAGTPAFRHVRARGLAAFVVDDVAPPWRPRSLEIRGPAVALETDAGAVLRISPARISSRGLDGTPFVHSRRLDSCTGRESS